MIYVALLLGCLFLFKGGGWLLDGMLGIGQKLNLSKVIIGLILVSLGTSAPELFVSVGAALQGHGGMAAGNVLGSNIINISIVLGLTICVVAINVERVLQYQILSVVLISVCVVWVALDGLISRPEGLILIAAMAASFIVAIKYDTNRIGDEQQRENETITAVQQSLLLTVGGILTLLVGAEALIWGGLELAEKLLISETVVALTVTSIGTSLPEIAASLVAIVRRDIGLALGNVIGSNLLNIGLVLGTSATIIPLQNVDFDGLTLMFFVGLTIAIYVFSIKPGYLPRWLGYILIASYLAYVSLLINS